MLGTQLAGSEKGPEIRPLTLTRSPGATADPIEMKTQEAPETRVGTGRELPNLCKVKPEPKKLARTMC